MKNKASQRMIYGSSGVFLIFIGWILYSLLKDNALFFPGPYDVFLKLVHLFSRSSIYLCLLFDFLRVVSVLTISVAVTTGLLYLVVKYPVVRNFMIGPLTLLKSSPIVAIAIFIMITFESTFSPIVITFLVCFPLFYQNIIFGFDMIDQDLKDELKMVGPNSFSTTTYIYLPMLKPYFIGGVIQTLGLSLKTLITAEFLCYTKNSFGRLIYEANGNVDIASILAITIVIFFIVMLCDYFSSRYLNNIAHY